MNSDERIYAFSIMRKSEITLHDGLQIDELEEKRYIQPAIK